MNGSKVLMGSARGDPISPMIFILAIEVLTSLFSKAQQIGIISGFKAKAGGIGIPILQYVDDTLVLIDGNFKESKVV